MDGPTDGRMDGQTDGRREHLPILQDFVPYRGRCPKSNNLSKMHGIEVRHGLQELWAVLGMRNKLR